MSKSLLILKASYGGSRAPQSPSYGGRREVQSTSYGVSRATQTTSYSSCRTTRPNCSDCYRTAQPSSSSSSRPGGSVASYVSAIHSIQSSRPAVNATGSSGLTQNCNETFSQINVLILWLRLSNLNEWRSTL